MEIYLSNIECPECKSHNCIKYIGRFGGIYYGCGDCNLTFSPPVKQFSDIEKINVFYTE